VVEPDIRAASGVTALRVIAAALFAAFNLVPLYGLVVWGWDAFQLLLLYWGETAILFLCTLAHIACIPPTQLGTMLVNGKTVPAGRLMMVGFFAVHGGMFLAGHLFFLCVLFSDSRLGHLGGVAGFVRTFFVVSGAWAPLVLVALAGTLDVLTGPYHPAFVDAFARAFHVALARPKGAAPGQAVGSVVGGLYVRVVIMQVAIIFGAFAATVVGSAAPLVILVVLKTAIDFVVRLSAICGAAPAPLLSRARAMQPG
jgi:hypothetical protein